MVYIMFGEFSTIKALTTNNAKLFKVY